MIVYEIKFVPIRISDAPAYSYRGVMIDSARHYLSPSTIRKVMDGMVLSKLNVLHWHIVDAESFPFVSSSYPDLTKYGAYHSSKIYDRESISSLIDHAAKRGIRIIPEMDSPGHTAIWGKAPELKEIAFVCNKYNGQMNPTIDLTYKVVEGVMNDFAESFPDEFLHLGGDEVDHACWLSNKEIALFMQKNNISDAVKLQNYYKERQKKLLPKGKKAVYWVYNENFDFADDEIIQFWGISTDLASIQNKTNKLILSPYDVLYLDVGFGNLFGGDYGKMKTWKQIYLNFKPKSYNLDSSRILGGEVCLWGEVNSDETMENKLWPRSNAFSERVWNGEETDDLVDIATRVINAEKRYRRAGFNVSPASSEWCSQNIEICWGKQN